MSLSNQRRGEFYMLGESLLWSLFPVITVITYNSLSPLISLSISSFFSILFFAAIMTQKKLWHELKNRAAYINIFFSTLIIGIIYYLLVFFGLQHTSPGNASLIALTQIFFSFLLFHVFKKEHIPTVHILGGLLMVAGALTVLLSSFQSFHSGDMLILLANAIAPVGNLFQQRARKQITSETLMFSRSILSTFFIISLTLSLQTPISLPAIQNSLPFLLINGILLLGLSKILWLEAIHRISVTKATSMGSIEPLLTLFFAWLLLQQIPTAWQLLSIVPICLGVILLSKKQAEDVTIET